MKTILNKLALATLAGALIAPAVEAQTPITFVGGNATQKIIQYAVSNLVLQPTSVIYEPDTGGNAQIFTYIGYLQSDNSYVQLNFNLTGGAGAINDLYNQTAVPIYNGSTAFPNAAVSITGPGTIGFTSAQIANLTELPTLGAPTVFVTYTNSLLPNSINSITNLTSRQATFLEGFSGDASGPYSTALTTSALGGSSTTDPIYFVGRNSLAAVRNVTDANIYYSTLIDSATFPVINWTTNASGVPVVYTNATLGTPPSYYWGAGSGGEVVSILKAITNSIGTLAIGDVVSGIRELTYEGVPFSVTNVENGTYPLWGVERYIYGKPGNGAGIPTPTGVTLESITNLVNVITSASFANNELVTNLYVPLTLLNNGAVGVGGVNNGGVSRDLDTDGKIIQLSPYNQPY